MASHLLYTQKGILNDQVRDERKLGIEAGLVWGEQAEATVVYVDRGVSWGMEIGITHAKLMNRRIEYRALYARTVVQHKDWHPTPETERQI